MVENDNKLEVARRETERLKREALGLCIDIPNKPGWWFENEDFYGGKTIEEIELTGGEYLLTEEGMAGVKGLIKRELATVRDRRIRWACMIIGALAAVGGVIFAIMRQ